MPELRWYVAVLSLGAAAIHFAVIREHFVEFWFFGWFFVAASWFQAGWALAIVSTEARAVAFVGTVVNALLVVAYAWTRLVSVPIGPDAGRPEVATLLGAAVLTFELAVIAGSLALLRAPPLRPRTIGFPWRRLAVAAAVCALVGVVLAAGGG